MPHLYELIQRNVSAWRRAGYTTDQYPAIGEILEYATLPESGSLRFLRAAQLQALETYWYLRLVEGTPHIFDLYQKYNPGPPSRRRTFPNCARRSRASCAPTRSR